MLKRNGKVANGDHQLILFDFDRSREPADLPDAIRTNGRAPLARIPAENGARVGGEGHLNGIAVRGPGENNRRNGSPDTATGNGAEADATTGARPSLGDD